MRKTLSVLLAIFVLIFAVNAMAEVIETTVNEVVVKTDKNGKEYVRLIIPITKSESGITWDDTVPAMVFSNGENTSLVEYAKTLKPGDKIKCAVKKRIYQGSEYFTILKFAE